MKERIPRHVSEFRSQYRTKTLPRWYSGYAHAAATVVLTLSCAAFCVLHLHTPSLTEWVTVPVMLIMGNGFEYFLHRGPLHKPTWPVKKIFEIHTVCHHHYFTHESMVLGDDKDIHMVLFPWWSPVLLIMGLPLLTLALDVSSNIRWMMIGTGALNFLFYEFMHFSFHLAANPFTDWIPGMKFMRRHHTLHHDPRLMSTKNFNVVFPLFDVLMKTRV